MIKLIATFFFVGRIPFAPGTWGSLAALPFGYALHVLGGPILLAAATAVVFFLGWWATIEMTRGAADPDPSEIVIDEVVGQWIALLPLSIGMSMMGADPSLFPWPGWVGAFVLFRLFDILKPGPVGWADRLHSPLGVMLDDVIAGVFAALCVLALAAVAHGWMV
jgi:phosphatidylglycerophosphatase A